MSFSIPKDSESEYVPMDAKPLWLVPYVAGVDQRRSPSLTESPWDERSDEEDCYVSESHCSMVWLRGTESVHVVRLFHREDISAGLHERDSSKSCIAPNRFHTSI